MCGTPSLSNMRLLLTSVLCTCFILSSPSALCAHAVVSLKDGNQITGELSSIDTKGNVKILSPVSNAELEIIHSSVLDITFSNKVTTSKHTSELVHLNNGDLLPCSLLSLDRTSVRLNTWYAEDFKIPTSTVSNIEFHSKPDSIIYSGPNADDIWHANTNWSIEPKALSCMGKGEISRRIDIPQNFIFKSTITWKSTRPSFKIHFCGDSNKSENMVDSYSLDFTTNAIQVIRSSKSQPRAQIGTISLRLRELSSNSIDVELHVDRRTQTLSVKLNGEQYGIFNDTSFRVPTGEFINFQSKIPQSTDSLTITDISVSQWRGSNLSSGDKVEELDLDQDTLFDTEGLRFTGEIQQLSRENKSLNFSVKYANKPMLVPISRIKSLYLSGSAEEKVQNESVHYSISLHGGGTLSVESITLSSDYVSAKHPILGKITLTRSSLNKITSTSNTDE